jgi:tRNA (guanine37-N1)-methyltransferase
LIKKVQEYSRLDHLVIVAGHYEDVDARVLDFIDEEISMGTLS